MDSKIFGRLNTHKLRCVIQAGKVSMTLPSSSLIPTASVAGEKIVWLQTENEECVTAALQAGISSTVLLDAPGSSPVLGGFQRSGRLNAVVIHPDGSLRSDSGDHMGRFFQIGCPADLEEATIAATTGDGFVVVDACDWAIIPAENLIAVRQSNKQRDCKLLAVVHNAAASKTMLESLERGVDGVVLAGSDPAEVSALAGYLRSEGAENEKRVCYQTARVVTVRPLGLGDRVCVDTASIMMAGEGLLIGNFARGLFLVHSECEESGYINARPFRVNAGPVHAYVQAVENKTKYLTELRTGDEVLIADWHGKVRPALIGRVKIERRPLVLVEAIADDGILYSILLQNAETVKLVGPDGDAWRAISVPALKPDDKLYVLVQHAARHAGMQIEEEIIER